VRELTNHEKILEFMRSLGRHARQSARVYFRKGLFLPLRPV